MRNKDMQPGEGIRTERLTIGYDKDLIREITLSVHPGEIVTIIGPNGCGKSTLLKTVAGQLRKRGGMVYLDGRDREEYGIREAARHLAMVTTQKVHPELMTCREVVATGRYPYTGVLGILAENDKRVVTDTMERTGITPIADSMFDSISDGQRQRVLLARAVCQEPEILLLDEPASYLDIRYRLELLTFIRSLASDREMAILMTMHELDAAMKISDTVVAMDASGIRRIGTVKEVFREDFIRELYGIEGMDLSLLGEVPWLV